MSKTIKSVRCANGISLQFELEEGYCPKMTIVDDCVEHEIFFSSATAQRVVDILNADLGNEDSALQHSAL